MDCWSKRIQHQDNTTCYHLLYGIFCVQSYKLAMELIAGNNHKYAYTHWITSMGYFDSFLKGVLLDVFCKKSRRDKLC